MLISVNVISSTAEAVEGARQTVTALGDALSRLSGVSSSFSQVDGLTFGLTIAHPITAARSARDSRSYGAGTRTFYAKSGL